MFIAENLTQIKSQLPAHVTLVAVSKTKPVADLMEAYDAGQRIFGQAQPPPQTAGAAARAAAGNGGADAGRAANAG